MTDAPEWPDRRRFLAEAGTVAVSMSLAGCKHEDEKEEVIEKKTASAAGLSGQAITDLGYPGLTSRTLPARSVTKTTQNKEYGFTLVDKQVTYGTAADVDFPAFVRATSRAIARTDELNRLVREPLQDLVRNGPFGIEFLQGHGYLKPGKSYEWVQQAGAKQPAEVQTKKWQLLGGQVKVGRYEGEVSPKGSSSKTLVNVGLARRTAHGESVLAGIAKVGTLPRSANRFMFVLEHVVKGVTRNPPTSVSSTVDTSFDDPRLVQTVADTAVRQRSPEFQVADPDLVADRYVAPLFGVGGSTHPKRAYVDVTAGSNHRDFDLERTTLNNAGGIDRMAEVFDANAQNSTGQHPWPFRITTGTGKATFRAEAPCGYETDETTIRKGSDYDVTTTRPLRVGFISCYDRSGGNHYGDSNGHASTYDRTVEVAIQYMRRVFPGDLVAYRHDGEFGGHKTGSNIKTGNGGGIPFLNDVYTAKWILDRQTQYPAKFPSNGTLWAFGQKRSAAEHGVEQNGFDAWVLIVPVGYYAHHGWRAAGKAPSPILGVNYWGVSAVEQAPTWDRDAAQTVAHELGHFYGGNLYKSNRSANYPMAQRDTRGSDTPFRSPKLDFHHARHLDSDNDGDGNDDAPGVTSLAFDFVDGSYRHVDEFSVDPGKLTVKNNSRTYLESFMSYEDGESLWTDARMHQKLIDVNYGNPTLSEAVFEAEGTVGEEDAVRFETVRVGPGRPLPAENEDGPVGVEMRAPDGEVLASRQAHDSVELFEGGETVNRVPVRMPFPMPTARVLVDREGTTTTLNPVVRPIRDAVDRVPERGLVDDPGEARGRIDELLADIEVLMSDRAYEAAIERLAELDELVAEVVRDEYDADADQPERGDLHRLAERMYPRLEALAEY